MMQDAAAIDVVEPPQIGSVQEGAGVKPDRRQSPGVCAGFGDAPRRRRQVDIVDLERNARGCQALRQLDQTIARAAPGDQRAKGAGPVALSAKEEMVDLKRL